METLEVIHKRRAVRNYRDERPSQQQLRSLIAAASWAPSAMNDQDWNFIVITDGNILDRISLEAKAWMLSAGEQNEHLRKILSDPQSHLLHHAPALIIIAAPAEHRWAAENCAVAAENLMLVAADMGLGTCWIGLVQNWLNCSGGRKLVGLSPNDCVVAPIVVGYAQREPSLILRKKPAIVWMDDDDRLEEDGGGIQPIGVPGLYGTLIHP